MGAGERPGETGGETRDEAGVVAGHGPRPPGTQGADRPRSKRQGLVSVLARCAIMPNVLARVLIGSLAVLVLLWVGVLLRDHVVSESASPLLYQAELSEPEFDRNIARLEDAQLLNPDSSLDLARATYLMLRGRDAQAIAATDELLEAEPDNVAAWNVLLDASRGSHPARAAQARAEVRRLNPRGG